MLKKEDIKIGQLIKSLNDDYFDFQHGLGQKSPFWNEHREREHLFLIINIYDKEMENIKNTEEYKSYDLYDLENNVFAVGFGFFSHLNRFEVVK